jgi:membrane associated rhomboid family serine protease
MFILVLILGVSGVLSAFFDAFSLHGFDDDYLMILLFAIIMIFFYRMPKRWIFGSDP